MKEPYYVYSESYITKVVPTEYRWNVAIINILLLLGCIGSAIGAAAYSNWFFALIAVFIIGFGLHASFRDFEIRGNRDATYVSYLEPENVDKNAAYKKAVEDCVKAIKTGAFSRPYWSKVFEDMNDEIRDFEAKVKERKIKELPTLDYLQELKTSHELYLKGTP